MDRFVLKLYIIGSSQRSQSALSALRNACAGALRDKMDLIVVDVMEHPDVAERERIIATPTLVVQHPLPVRRFIGDFSSIDMLIKELGLPCEQSARAPEATPAKTTNSVGEASA